MKTKMKSILTVLLASLLTSCATTFYQVYKVSPSDRIVNNESTLVYEDENCKVFYNLWGEGGDIGFRFYNKTDVDIFLNLQKSFFILNGIAYDYYKNRIFTNSTSAELSTSQATTASKSVTGFNFSDLLQTNKIQSTNKVGIMSSSGYSVAFNEEKVICIPSKTSKIITEYNINESLYRDCDLFKYPKSDQIKSKSFSKSDSPIVFSNRISYAVGNSDNLIRFENEFYVAEITNYPENEILETGYDEYCGQKSITLKSYFKDVSPDKFFIKYKQEQDSWKR